MRSVEASEKKTTLKQLLQQVAGGEEVTLTSHGMPVALLRPMATFQALVPEERIPHSEIVARMEELRRGNRLNGLTLREMIEEGRK